MSFARIFFLCKTKQILKSLFRLFFHLMLINNIMTDKYSILTQPGQTQSVVCECI